MMTELMGPRRLTTFSSSSGWTQPSNDAPYISTNTNVEALKEGEIAKDLEPFSPASDMNPGGAFYFARQYERSIDYLLKNLERNPDHLPTLNVPGFAYEREGMLKESIDVLQKLYSRDKSYGAAALGYAYARAGRRDEALKILDYLSKQPGTPSRKRRSFI